MPQRLSRSFGTLAAAGLLLAGLSCTQDQWGARIPSFQGKICTANSDCGNGKICVAGLCEEAARCESDADCAGGECDLLRGVCKLPTVDPTDGGEDPWNPPDGGPDGGDGGSDGGPDDGGPGDGGDGGPVLPSSCTSKCDCPDNYICRNSKCISPGSGCNTAADCPKGKICNYTGTCVTGCAPDGPCDCPADKFCHPNKYLCEGCSLTNPCPGGQTCVGGACITPPSCSTTADCASKQDGTICVGGACTNCNSHSDCGVAPYKDANPKKSVCAADGLCKAPSCNDADCKKSLGDKAYCDTVNNTCATRECLTDTDCASGLKCDPVSFRCADPGGCTGDVLDQCRQSCQAQSRTCNEVACNCAGGGSGGGGQDAPCSTDADCDTGAGYFCGLGLCSEKCQLPFMTGSVTGRTCDALGCFFLTFFFGVPICF